MLPYHRLSSALTPRRLRGGLAATAGLVLLLGAGTGRGLALGNPGVPATPDSPTGTYSNGTLLTSGRLITPAGTVANLGDFPTGMVISPDRTFAVVSNSGQGEGLNTGGATESLQVVDLSTNTVTQTVEDHATGQDTFYNSGLAFSPDGTHLYATGGGNDEVYDYSVSAKTLTLAHSWITTQKRTGNVISTTQPYIQDFIGYSRGVAITPDAGTLIVTNEQGGSVVSISTATGAIGWETQLSPVIPGGAYPGAVAISGDGSRAYVTEQGLNTLAILDTKTGAPVGAVPVGDHPVAAALSSDGHYAYVANANDDSLSIVDLTANPPATTRQLSTHLFAGEANGSSPNAIALDEAHGRIYVTNAGDNAIAVFGSSGVGGAPPGTTIVGVSDNPTVTTIVTGPVSVAASASVNTAPPLVSVSLSTSLTGPIIKALDPVNTGLLGFIPTAQYPAAVAVKSDTAEVLATSAKGFGGVPVTSHAGYDGNNMVGTFQRVAYPDATTLAGDTTTAQNDLAFATQANSRRASDNPIPDYAHRGQSPIKHVVLIVRENRTFDQVFGDLPAASADVNSSYVEFPKTDANGKTITVNAHQIAAQYGLSDNFYSDGEASLQGHHWTSAGTETDYGEKAWGQIGGYSNRNHPYDPTLPIVYPRCGALFQQAAAQGKTFRDFGELVGLATSQAPTVSAAPDAGCAMPGGNQDAVVAANTDPAYPNNLLLTQVKDTDRFTEFKNTYDPLVQADKVPSLTYLLMGNDHTDGLTPGKPTPQAHVATNDLAVGQVVDYLSHTPQWSSTAVFIEEDDSQDGLDHEDGHRNILIVASPFAVPGKVSHVHTSQASVTHAIELILGLTPLSSFSQNAPVPYDLFQGTATAGTYTATTPTYPLTAVNPAAAPASAASFPVDTTRVDLAGPLLEAQLWQATHGAQALPGPLVSELRARSRVPAATIDAWAIGAN